ncbi:MAG: fluoride efflux transporter CrcB [Gemmataceae bacterium]|nr:fluoride efflux transporter CrcB [Gemmata sp.]MDW8197706.1 fluoride efflux transporter CrcB [Gemmataceae bacterium]
MVDGLVSSLLLLLGGGLGANARYWLGVFVRTLQGPVAFPIATLLINVGGSFCLGFCVTFFRNHPDPSRKYWYLLLGTGLCGGFTTFSTFSLETLELLQQNRLIAASAYVFGSVFAAIFGVWLALKLSGGRIV